MTTRAEHAFLSLLVLSFVMGTIGLSLACIAYAQENQSFSSNGKYPIPNSLYTANVIPEISDVYDVVGYDTLYALTLNDKPTNQLLTSTTCVQGKFVGFGSQQELVPIDFTFPQLNGPYIGNDSCMQGPIDMNSNSISAYTLNGKVVDHLVSVSSNIEPFHLVCTGMEDSGLDTRDIITCSHPTTWDNIACFDSKRSLMDIGIPIGSLVTCKTNSVGDLVVFDNETGSIRGLRMDINELARHDDYVALRSHVTYNEIVSAPKCYVSNPIGLVMNCGIGHIHENILQFVNPQVEYTEQFHGMTYSGSQPFHGRVCISFSMRALEMDTQVEYGIGDVKRLYGLAQDAGYYATFCEKVVCLRAGDSIALHVTSNAPIDIRAIQVTVY